MPNVTHTMQGTRTAYNLDIDNIFLFPDWENLPVFPPKPDETWCMLYEIMEMDLRPHPRFWCQDKLPDYQCAIHFLSSDLDGVAQKCKPGYTLCLKDFVANTKRGGYRITDASRVKLLPCGLAQIKELNAILVRRSAEGKMRNNCIVCDSETKSSCGGGCKTPYCSKACQKHDWKEHKEICTVLKTLHEWNRTDWG